MSQFLSEFNHRVKRIKEGRAKYVPAPEPPVSFFKITRYRSDGSVVDLLWNLPKKDAVGLMAWKFKSHIKHEEGEEILIWYKMCQQPIII